MKKYKRYLLLNIKEFVFDGDEIYDWDGLYPNHLNWCPIATELIGKRVCKTDKPIRREVMDLAKL